MVFRRCQGCGLLQKDPSLFPDPLTEKARYEQHSQRVDPGYVRWVEKFVDEAIVPFVLPGEALDFGAGRTGEMARQLISLGHRVCEYDPWFAPDPLVLGRQYDLVTVLEVAEHFQDPAAEWQRLDSLLRSGGYLAIHTAFLPVNWTEWWYLRDVTHVTFYPDSCWPPLAGRFGWIITYDNHQDCIVFQKPGT